MYKGYWAIFLIMLCGCKPKTEQEAVQSIAAKDTITISFPEEEKIDSKPLKSFEGLADTTFVRLADFSADFVYDMRYATTNNFLKAKVYDCAECYTRARTAKALIQANASFMKMGYKLKFFDCYRPNAVQYKMWELMPNPQYVANPVKGSIHNKGGAVDVTLVTINGEALDMGTDFDFFGKEAHHDYTQHPDTILQNRKLLRETMEKHGFWGIRTEWWHYNLSGSSKERIANFKWECE